MMRAEGHLQLEVRGPFACAWHCCFRSHRPEPECSPQPPMLDEVASAEAAKHTQLSLIIQPDLINKADND